MQTPRARVVRATVSLWLPALLASAITGATGEPERVIIASVNPFGPAQLHVRNLLRRAGVTDSITEGSVVYGVSVPKDKAAVALRVLRKDARRRPYMYVDVQGLKVPLGEPPDRTWPVRELNLPSDQVEKAPALAKDANLRMAAEAALRMAARMLPLHLKKIPPLELREVRLLTLRYDGGDGHDHVGYHASVDIGFRAGGGERYVVNLYVWDVGREVQYVGWSHHTSGVDQSPMRLVRYAVSTPTGPDDTVLVASGDNMGIGPVNIANLMKLSGVREWALHGSRGYGLSVRKDEVPQALAALQKDARVHPYLYGWVLGIKGPLGPPDPKTWPVRKLDLTLAQIDAAQEFKSDPNLRALATYAIRSTLANPYLTRARAKALKSRMTVHLMRLFAMEYRGDDLRLHRGYRAEIEVGVQGRPDMKASLSGVYVWDDGRKVVNRSESLEGF